jgi:multidrug efflux pump subunit AcrA (membrane-fusion protein)
MLDTAAARQQLLLRQQQEVQTFAHRQLVEQQAQQLVNSALAVGTTSTTPITQQLSHQRQQDHHRLNALLNEACVLAPVSQSAMYGVGGVLAANPMMGGGISWLSSASHLHPYPAPPVTVLGGQPVGFAASGALPIGQEELMQAVRRELKKMQQE